MEESSPPPPPTTLRRNPHRRARKTPFVPDSLSRFNAADVASTLLPFSLDEAPETLPPLPPLPSPSPTPDKPADTTTSSNLKVFLRVRPTEIKSQPRRPLPSTKNPNPRARCKGSPQKAKKKKKTEVCLAVNGPESVTLAIPKSKMVDSKRGNKSEVYDGFSFVFPPESLQTDVYDKVMNPLVKDFMGGKSALLVAMGPTGSGKTHTMFGSNREPGLVPLALKKIFSSGEKSSSQHRSFYLAMFEIYSVSGKGEKMIDLLSDGAELTLLQSTIKGLEEVPVLDIEGAERLVARGMLKRSTAATDANSQSSRSQCIITIRRANDVFYTGNDMAFGNGILVIADLAGAERDRKTGNTGSRLGESHFINNTSMIFGLCLRSLLEHQKNPRRPLEMHYKNSLLTRYLKEYLEGKKRMTLILTVKPGEDDYVDTSFVLRQAAPYMKIKYTNTEEVNALPPVQKRNNIAPVQQGNKKRRKVNSTSSSSVGGETHVDLTEAVEISGKVDSEKLEVVQAIRDPTIPKTDATVDTSTGDGGLNAELQKAKRNEVHMTQFARAFWKTLKLYKDKLLKSENEVHSLRGTIIEKNRRIMELEEELATLKSCQKQSEPAISSLDENEVANPASVSELSQTTDDSKHYKSSGYKYSSAGSRKRGTPSSSNSNASSSITPSESCEQEGNEDKQSENLIEKVKEKACLPFDSAQLEEKHFVEGDLLEMVCPDSDTDEGQMPSTENEIESSIQHIKAKALKVADDSASIMIEARRQSIESSSRNAVSSGGGFAEGSDRKIILRFEGSTAISSRDSDASASIALREIDLLSDFEQATKLSEGEKADKKSEDLLEEEGERDDASCDKITEKHFDPHFAEGYPLQIVCPNSDSGEEKIPSENEIQCSTQLHEAKASEDADSSPSLLIKARRQSIELTSQNAGLSGGGFAEVSGVENILSFKGSTDEPKNDILELAVEVAPSNSVTSLNLCQTIQEPEVVVLKNDEIFDKKSANLMEKEEKHDGRIVDLEHPEFSPNQILRDNHFYKDDSLQMVCPDSNTDEEEMLSTEKKIRLYVQHIEVKAFDIANFSPLVTEAKRQSSEFVTQRKSSSGGYFADGSETRKSLSFEGSADEASDNTLEQTDAGDDATNSASSFHSQETFQESQENSCSSEETKLELENEKSANSEELEKETTPSPVEENSALPVIVEPKKVESSTDHEGKSSIERRKENQPIKSLIEAIGKENRASHLKPIIARKPKRRLRPASSMLLKEFTSPDIDPEIPKEGRGKASAEEMARSEGSMSLIQLLKDL